MSFTTLSQSQAQQTWEKNDIVDIVEESKMWVTGLIMSDDEEEEPIQKTDLKKFKELKLGIQIEMKKWCPRCMGLGQHAECKVWSNKDNQGMGIALLEEINERIDDETPPQGIIDEIIMPSRKHIYLRNIWERLLAILGWKNLSSISKKNHLAAIN